MHSERMKFNMFHLFRTDHGEKFQVQDSGKVHNRNKLTRYQGKCRNWSADETFKTIPVLFTHLSVFMECMKTVSRASDCVITQTLCNSKLN